MERGLRGPAFLRNRGAARLMQLLQGAGGASKRPAGRRRTRHTWPRSFRPAAALQAAREGWHALMYVAAWRGSTLPVCAQAGGRAGRSRGGSAALEHGLGARTSPWCRKDGREYGRQRRRGVLMHGVGRYWRVPCIPWVRSYQSCTLDCGRYEASKLILRAAKCRSKGTGGRYLSLLRGSRPLRPPLPALLLLNPHFRDGS